MSLLVPIHENIFWTGVDDWETERFENLWPLPKGISYNSYLVLDNKVALIDGVKGNLITDFFETIKKTLPEQQKIDYLVINHIEPDHSGSIPRLIENFPEIRIIGNRKTADFLEQFYSIRQNVQIIEDGDILDLGKHKLRFILTPMVHWPETMMTYEETAQILFSGDVFGSFGALDGAIFDDEIFDMKNHEDEILRYFSNVIGRYSTMVQKAFTKIADLPFRMIASTHGPVWRKDPRKIQSLYDRWSKHETDAGVVIAYASMYGNTEKMMEAIGHGLAAENISSVTIHNVSKSHLSYMLSDIWRNKALILGTPTYNMKPFPQIDALVRILENKMMKNRLISIFGSYGWSGGGVKTLTEFAKNDHGWELVEPVVEAHCAPKEEDLRHCRELGKTIARRLKS